MADINKDTLVEKLTDIADGFRTSRSLTETLSLDEMAVLAAVPIQQGGNNLLVPFIEGTLTEITAADLEGLTTLGRYAFASRPLTSVELPSTLAVCENESFVVLNSTFKTIKYQGTTGQWAQIAFGSNGAWPSYNNVITNFYFLNNLGEYYKLEDDLVIEGVEKINSFSFYNLDIPRNIIIGSSIKEIGAYAFNECSNVVNLTLNEGLEQIQSYAFRYCNAIQKLVIPNSVQSINSRTFGNNNSLNEVRIGNGITQIHATAFASCPNLTDIYIDKPEGSIASAPWGATNATVHWNTPLPTN